MHETLRGAMYALISKAATWGVLELLYLSAYRHSEPWVADSMASRSMRDYIASNYSFGNARFFSESTLGAYYGAGSKTFLLFLVLAIPIIAIGILPLLGPILALRDGAAVKDAVGALDEASSQCCNMACRSCCSSCSPLPAAIIVP